jgi:ribosomal protein L13E
MPDPNQDHRPQDQQQDSTPDEQPEYKYTDRDLDKYKGTARKEGREAASRELADQLGVSVDEAKQIISDHRKREEAQKTELDKANERIKELESKSQTTAEKAAARIKKTELKLALRNEGINPERLDMAVRLADLDSLEVDDEGNVAGLEDVVKAVSEASPEWFTTTEEPRQQRRAPELGRKSSPGLDGQIAEAREKGDWRTVERLNAQKLQQSKAG